MGNLNLKRGDRCEVQDGDPDSPTHRQWLPAQFIATDLVAGEPIVQVDKSMPIFATWGTVRVLTYFTEGGEEKNERRRRSREKEDPCIDHLFNGFDNLISITSDEYNSGYLKAMRAELGRIVIAWVK